MNQKSTAHAVIFLALLALAAAVRIPLVFTAHPFYSSDTAIVDLMARHFLKGEWSFYYWGEHYYGVLDPVLLMPLFKLFGQTPAVSGIVPFLMALFFILFFHQYVRKECGVWIAHGATLLLVLPPTIFLRYTFGTYNYSFGACMGMALLTLGHGIRLNSSPRRWFLFGLCSGFSYYYFRFAMLFYLGLLISGWGLDIAAQSIQRLRAEWHTGGWSGIGRRYILLQNTPLHPIVRMLAATLSVAVILLILFCLPLWLHGNVDRMVGDHRLKLSFWYTLRFTGYLAISGLALTYWRTWVGWLKLAWSFASLRALAIGFLLGFSPGIVGCLFGEWPNSPGKIVSLPISLANLGVIKDLIIPAMIDPQPSRFMGWFLAGSLAVGAGYIVGRTMVFLGNRLRGKDDHLPVLLLIGFLSLLLAVFGMKLGVGTGRYLLPFMIALPLGQVLVVAGVGRRFRTVAVAAVLLLATAHGMADLRLFHITRGTDALEAVSQHLLAKGFRAGYADYWIAYHLTAISQERFTVAPTGDNDRYPPYLQAAREQETPFLLTYSPVPRANRLDIKGISYRITGEDIVNGVFIYSLKKAV